jgi:hypothetical protein
LCGELGRGKTEVLHPIAAFFKSRLPFGLVLQAAAGCGPGQPVAAPAPPAPTALVAEPPPSREPERVVAPEPRPLERPAVVAAPAACAAADWTARALTPLLRPGKTRTASRPDQLGAAQLVFNDACTDAPGGPPGAYPEPIVLDGVRIALVAAEPAGQSGRGWRGNQCRIDVQQADGAGQVTHLGPQHIPPFTTITALVRAGSAAYLSIGFNGYNKEFPAGGNRVLALDLCQGKVVWQSKDAMSNGGLLLLGDYLVSPYGFTSERRYVFVLDAHSGGVVQKLPMLENVCPNSDWAGHIRPGERCDAPGQLVGAASNPRVVGGLLLVDTNTGSTAFSFY